MKQLDTSAFNKREAVGFVIVGECFAQLRLWNGCYYGFFGYYRILHLNIKQIDAQSTSYHHLKQYQLSYQVLFKLTFYFLCLIFVNLSQKPLSSYSAPGFSLAGLLKSILSPKPILLSFKPTMPYKCRSFTRWYGPGTVLLSSAIL